MGDWNAEANDIFLKALDIASPEDRRAYLDGACGDAGLRAQVEALLAADQQAGGFLQEPAPGLTGITGETLREGPGTLIGPYKLLEQIGEGGFGVVFMAEQQHPVRRKVALKVIKPGMDTKQVIARFEAERQALALMDHPHIARVLDAGATSSGLPYFVMELVRGVPLTDFCDRNELTARERLELFVAVCQAVQHAHQKGIIHRDLKPSNVLVTLHDGTPVVKVIDFGIAKALGQQLTDKTLFTGFAQMLGTPLYISPEQAEMSGLDIDTRADIYSLGVLLYELLTGTTPLDKERLGKAAFDEIRRLIREEEAPRPSTRITTMGEAATPVSARRKTDPRHLSQLLRGELDWIVLKALEKDRNRRYETASAFAADVHRYLHDEAVSACPPSAAYRFRKFALRNKGALTTAGIITLALLAGTAISVWQAIRATHAEALARDHLEAETEARREAVANLEQAHRAVNDYFVQVSETDLLNVPGLQPLRKELLETALRYYQDFLERSGDDPRLRAELAKTYTRVGLINRAVGSLTKAVENHQKALAFWQRLAEENPAAAEYQAELGTVHIEIGYDLGGLRQSREALASYQQAVAVLEKLVDAQPDHADFQDRLARAYGNLGYMQSFSGRGAGTAENESRLAAEALHSHRQALNIREALVRGHPGVPEFKRTLATRLDTIGLLQLESGDHEGALRAHERALAIRDELARLAPGNLRYEAERGKSHNSIGDVHRAARDWDKAIRSYERAIEVEQRLVRRSPAVTTYQRRLQNSYANLATVYRNTRQLDKAFALYPPLVEILERLLFASFREEELNLLVGTYSRLLAGLRTAKAAGEALRVGERATAFLRDLAREQPTVTAVKAGLARVQAVIGDVHSDRNDVTGTLRAYEQATEILEELVRAFPHARGHRRELAQACYMRGRQYTYRKEHNEAVRLYARTIDLNPDHPSACYFLAWTFVLGPEKFRDPHKALPLARKAVELGPQSADRLRNLGIVNYRLGYLKEAEDCLVRAGELRPQRPDAVELFFRAMIHQRRGDADKARASYDQAMQSWKSGPKLREVWAEALQACRAEAEKLLGLTGERSKKDKQYEQQPER